MGIEVKPGDRLRSTVCATAVVVVKAPAGEIDLRCGGAPMVPLADAGEPSGNPVGGLNNGTVLGKRYTDSEGVEVLCSAGGLGTLSIGEVALELQGAKPLPSSD